MYKKKGTKTKYSGKRRLDPKEYAEEVARKNKNKEDFLNKK